MLANPLDKIIADLEAGIQIDSGYSESDASQALLQVIAEKTGLSIPEMSTLDYQVKDAIFRPTLKGRTLTGYCAVWLDDKGQEFIDSYHDHVAKNSFSSTITALKAQAHAQGHDYLVPLLWNHIRPRDGGLIGKVSDIQEDDTGVKFTGILADVPKAQEAYMHAKNNTCAASYGYDSLDHEYFSHPTKKYTNCRRIKKLRLHEISVIPAHSGAANPYTHLEAKSALMQHIKASGYDAVAMQRLFNQLDSGITTLQLQGIRNRE
jgi:HK97 family phage prohead protease